MEEVGLGFEVSKVHTQALAQTQAQSLSLSVYHDQLSAPLVPLVPPCSLPEMIMIMD